MLSSTFFHSLEYLSNLFFPFRLSATIIWGPHPTSAYTPAVLLLISQPLASILYHCSTKYFFCLTIPIKNPSDFYSYKPLHVSSPSSSYKQPPQLRTLFYFYPKSREGFSKMSRVATSKYSRSNLNRFHSISMSANLHNLWYFLPSSSL